MSEGRVTARGVAISALVAAEEGERANLVLPRMLSVSGLDERDRGFATELAYGALRMCRACDWLVGQFAKGELEPTVRAAARAGAYQLAFMRVPAYAAVSATVAECPSRARPLLNAVLRRIADLVAGGPIRWPGPGTKLSYPDWVLARLGEDLGAERALAALQQMNQAASPSTRPDGYIQDAGSQAVGEYVAGLLAGRPGPVLDLCAAPGGKTTFLAHGSPFVVGADVAPARVALVAGTPPARERRRGGGRRQPAAVPGEELCRGAGGRAVQRAGGAQAPPGRPLAGAARRHRAAGLPARTAPERGGATGGSGRRAHLQRLHPDPEGNPRYRQVDGRRARRRMGGRPSARATLGAAGPGGLAPAPGGRD